MSKHVKQQKKAAKANYQNLTSRQPMVVLNNTTWWLSLPSNELHCTRENTLSALLGLVHSVWVTASEKSPLHFGGQKFSAGAAS